MHRITATAVLAIVAGPAVVVVVLAMVVGAAFSASCATSSLTVGPIPAELHVTAADGAPVRLDRTQLSHAATIIQVGSAIAGVGRDGLLVALMAGLTESRLRMYANTGAYPHSGEFPHDGDGADHDSLGIFQMRPAAGWGSVAELMDPTYQARAFFGGPAGPNDGSPRGLLDIDSWQALSPGVAAQAVEVSAYPDRYARYEPVAHAILAALTTTDTGAPTELAPSTLSPARVVFPLPEGMWAPTSGFGMRVHPVSGVWKLHAGADFSADAGTPVLATADGYVVAAGPAGGLGNRIILQHAAHAAAGTSGAVASVYGHLRDGGVHVTAGDQVTAGQHIGDVGSTGVSTRAHLHFELRPGGGDQPAIDPQPWLDAATRLRSGQLLPPAGAAPECPATGLTGAVNS